ncbi:protein mono-ADP-ribosyltransferase PARP12-like [Cloeon dipterum]|uniref:protein mono-ADP-ribosyltransferase PARP12-like n=1 Tax=Cloeon dipterum TaxID=197152 RepID=UPI00321FC765
MSSRPIQPNQSQAEGLPLIRRNPIGPKPPIPCARKEEETPRVPPSPGFPQIRNGSTGEERMETFSESSLASAGPPPPLMKLFPSLKPQEFSSSASMQRKRGNRKKPVTFSETKTFLQAYPTRRLSDRELQSLLPPTWSPTCVRDFRLYNVVRVPLPPGFEFIVHKINVLLSGSGHRVRAITKLENPYQFLLYQLKMIENEGSHERVLFHGTSFNKIVSIATDNFNWRLAGSRVGHRHGLGVYFSTNPTFCLKFAWQDRCFLVARVQVGAITRGAADTRLPGPSADATGDGRNTVVKYHDHEFYPDFVVRY